MKIPRFGVYLLICLGMGCSSRPPALDIEEQWSDTMDRMSLSPIFPLSEDIMVGDVFLDLRGVEEVPDRLRPNYHQLNLLRIGRAPREDLLRVLRQQVADRIFIRRVPSAGAAPATPDPPPAITTTTNVTLGSTTTQTTTNVRPPSPPRPRDAQNRPPPPPPPPEEIADGRGQDLGLRLNLAAMPALSVARVSNFQLGGGGAFQSVAANLGFGRSSSTALTINLKDLQVLALEPRSSVSLLNSILANNDGTVLSPVSLLSTLYRYWREGAIAVCRNDTNITNKAQIVIFTNILFAGGISYQFGQSNEFAARAAIDASAALSGSASARPTSLPGLPAVGGSNAPAMSIADLSARVDALAASIPGAPAGSLLGAQTRLTLGTFGGLALEQTFSRLLAVGAGSTMRFSIQDAFIPINSRQIEDVIKECDNIIANNAAPNTNVPHNSEAFRRVLEAILAAIVTTRTADTARQPPPATGRHGTSQPAVSPPTFQLHLPLQSNTPAPVRRAPTRMGIF